MKKSQEEVADWMRKFGQETPEKPTAPDSQTCLLRSRLSLEETLEKIVHGFGVHRFECQEMALSVNFQKILEALKKPHEFVKLSPPDFVAIRDGIADTSVVNLGDAVACGVNANEDFNEVMRSNDSKMWTNEEVQELSTFSIRDIQRFILTTGIGIGEIDTPNELLAMKVSYSDRCWLVKNPSGKVIKSPSYSAANLKPLITP